MSSRFYPYATDSKERDVLAYCFAAIAIVLVWAISSIIGALGIHVPWWTAVPTPMAFYLILRGFFARYAWRWRILHRLGIVKIIDLNGTYNGHLWTSHDGSSRHTCTVIISQTWTGISIRGMFPKSSSFNGVTGISVEDTVAPRLTYEYWNTPNSDAVDSMQAHRDTIWFDIVRDDDAVSELKGDYYTGRGRETIGRIEVRREG